MGGGYISWTNIKCMAYLVFESANTLPTLGTQIQTLLGRAALKKLCHQGGKNNFFVVQEP